MEFDALEYLDGWSETDHPRDPAGRFGAAAAFGVAEHVAEHLTNQGTKASAHGTTVEHKTGKIHIGAGGSRHYAGGHEVAGGVEGHLKSHPSRIVKAWAEKSGSSLGEHGSKHPRPIRSGPTPPEDPNKSTARKVGEEIGYKLGEYGITKAVKHVLSKVSEVASQIKRHPDGGHADGARRVQRFDTGTLRPATKRENGWLDVEGMTARCGILEYEDGAGNVRRELVLPEELGDPASMASARMVPVTSPHPQALLDDKTARVHAVGSVGENIRMVGDHLAAPLLITDGDTVRDVEVGGRRQLSWGYDCRLDPPDESLFTKWGRHDGIQRDRLYNHLAIVDEARAGASARLRLDSKAACMLQVSTGQEPLPPTEESAMQIQIGTHRFDAKPESASLIQQAIDNALAESKSRADAARADADKSKLDLLAAIKRSDGILARAKGKLGRVRMLFDGMKARMMDCDECGGTGNVDDVDPSNLAQNAAIHLKTGNVHDKPHGDASRKCDYCDGSGKVRMHDAIKASAPVDEDAHPDEDMESMGEELAEDGLEREGAAEEGLEKAANPEHKDRAAKRKDARKSARDRRRDSIDRMAARRSIVRAALLTTAARFDPDAKFDGKPDMEVKRAVVAKLAPHLDAAKLDAAQVQLFYAAEVKRADAIGSETPTASDQLRAGLGYVPQVQPRRDGAVDRARATADAKANAYLKPMEQPKVASK